MHSPQHSKKPDFLTITKNGLWLFGITAWIFGMSDEFMKAFMLGGNPSAIDVIRLLTLTLCLIGWFCLRPRSAAPKEPELPLSNPN